MSAYPAFGRSLFTILLGVAILRGDKRWGQRNHSRLSRGDVGVYFPKATVYDKFQDSPSISLKALNPCRQTIRP